MKEENLNLYKGTEILKQNYIAPSIEVSFIEMEQGLAAASSASVGPAVDANGIVLAPTTQWDNNDDESVSQQF